MSREEEFYVSGDSTSTPEGVREVGSEEVEGEESEPEPAKHITRGDFLKIFSGSVAAWVLSDRLLKIFLVEREKDQANSKDPVEEGSSALDQPEADRAESVQTEPTVEQLRIEEMDRVSLEEVLDLRRSEPVSLDEETMEALGNHWLYRYSNDHRVRNGFVEGYYRMGEWMPYLKAAFRKYEIPEAYLFLAIPESEWQMEATSTASAVGPYQFIAKTARTYGLRVEPAANLDERRDPVRSALACARYLKDLYEAGQDWELAFSGYNGGFFWSYLSQCYKKDEEITYEGFLTYMEEKINRVRAESRVSEVTSYEIQPGDNLMAIAREMGVDRSELERLNGIEDPNRIEVGQRLRLPLSGEQWSSLNKELYRQVNGLKENINYPKKFYAVLQLIQEGSVNQQAEPVTFRVIQVGQNRESGSGESQTGVSLRQVAADHGVTPESLEKLNPAILDTDRAIPHGYEVRIPAGL